MGRNLHVGALVQVENHAKYMAKLAGRRLRQIAKEGPKAAKAEFGAISLADLIGEKPKQPIVSYRR
jgi:hypothetical protein